MENPDEEIVRRKPPHTLDQRRKSSRKRKKERKQKRRAVESRQLEIQYRKIGKLQRQRLKKAKTNQQKITGK